MIDLATGTVVFEGQRRPIRRWETWFRTPFGLAKTLQEAIEFVLPKDIDPILCIEPVPVAIHDGGHEVYVRA